MFTGIIEKVGSLAEIHPIEGGKALRLKISADFIDLALGESVAVNGVCLTVTEFLKVSEASSLSTFFVSQETQQSTQFKTIQAGDRVNLERSVALQTRLSGHLVQGHVDGTAQLVDLSSSSESHLLTFYLPKKLGRYCVPKGSIAINGVSLTLQSVMDQNDESTLIQVMIIPHTWTETNLSHLKLNQWVNIEVDILAKYVERLCKH